MSVVLDNLAANESPERILEQYPSLRPEHIPAAICYAAELARERIVRIPARAPLDTLSERSRLLVGTPSAFGSAVGINTGVEDERPSRSEGTAGEVLGHPTLDRYLL